jgi:hypothetical protein
VFPYAGGHLFVFNPQFLPAPGGSVLTFHESDDFCNVSRKHNGVERYSKIEAKYDDFMATQTKIHLVLSGNDAFCWQKMIDVHDGKYKCVQKEL